MNIKEWKKFSDLVDKENEKKTKRCEELNKSEVLKVEKWNKEAVEFNNSVIEENGAFYKSIRFPYFHTPLDYINKTEVNFWEWKAGKLKL
jgi:hypothetical protein